MPAYELIEHFRAPLGCALLYARAALAACCAWLAPVPACILVASRAAGDRLSRALFNMRRDFYALRDHFAAMRDSVPRGPNLPASTLLAYGAVGIMAAILVNDLVGPTPAVSSVASIPEKRPEWIDVPRPHGAFALESPVLDGIEARYSVRRHRAGGGRKDELVFGNPAKHGAYVRVSLYRPGTEGMAEPDPLEAVVAVAAEAGIEAELQETASKLKTKFGALPIVSMTIAGGPSTRACIAASGGWSDPRLGLVAWWCNEGPELVEHGPFACLLDRLALMSAGGDDRLAEFFAQAELRRNYCGGQSSFVSPTPRRPDDWIHAKGGPPLRGRLSAR